jgi:hypothetical protein
MKRHLIILLVTALPFALFGEQVTPSDRVQNFLNVRQSASGSSPIVGFMYPGDRLPLVSSVPGYYEVRLSDGTTGFVSKSWSELVPDAPPMNFRS